MISSGDLNILFVAIGAVSLLLGLAVMVAALRQGRESPKGVAMLIAGMMATAFGLLMAGFAIAYAIAPSPLEAAQ
jgi:hypothetical protein